jgi:CBS domain-containing protein
MTTVSEILKSKAEQAVHTVEPSASAFDAAQTMASRRIGGLLVVDGAQIIGIVTERDYAHKLVPTGRSPRDTPVRDIMSAPVMVVGSRNTSAECMALMTENRLRHLPVVDEGRLVGLVSIGDLVKDIIGEQRSTIEQLEHYISGQP